MNVFNDLPIKTRTIEMPGAAQRRASCMTYDAVAAASRSTGNSKEAIPLSRYSSFEKADRGCPREGAELGYLCGRIGYSGPIGRMEDRGLGDIAAIETVVEVLGTLKIGQTFFLSTSK